MASIQCPPLLDQLEPPQLCTFEPEPTRAATVKFLNSTQAAACGLCASWENFAAASKFLLPVTCKARRMRDVASCFKKYCSFCECHNGISGR